MSYPAKANCAGGGTDRKDCSLQSLITLDNLFEGFKAARRGKRDKLAVQKFEAELMVNLDQLYKEITSGTYTPFLPRKFNVSCRASGKIREIAAPSFRDSVVQHTIYRGVYHLFDRGFIYDSYGCRINKGTHKASDRCQKFLRKHSGESYFLQMDVKKFYYSIDHKILRQSLERKINDVDLIDLMMSFCDSPSGVGLNIGNLLSQLFGLIYLDRFDHFVKRVLKQKHYIRYVDDSVIIGLTREEALELKIECEWFLANQLRLEFSKWRIAKIKHGINFVGYRTWRSVKFVRKRSLHRFSKALRHDDEEVLASLLAHAKHSSSHKYMINRLNESRGVT